MTITRQSAHSANRTKPPSVDAIPTLQKFDAAYYRRFYLQAATRVNSRQDTERSALVVASIVAELQLPVRRIVDMGCGLGWFKRPLLKIFPQAHYVGVEYSEYLCDQYGWQQGSVVDYRGRGRFDLVTCCDVLQYLNDRSAAKALNNLARLSRGALYLHVPTCSDWQNVVDRTVTDNLVHLRPANWYQQRLRRHFVHVGNGVHVRRGVPFYQWELQAPWR